MDIDAVVERSESVQTHNLEQNGRKMNKRITNLSSDRPATEQAWLNLENMASVELTSEDDAFPIESALLGQEQGWRAAGPGIQTIRLIFDQPQSLRHICLDFVETEIQRTQEFTLRWSADGGNTLLDIVRQQWNFSSPNATREIEDYRVELSNVTLLDLTIDPDKENGKARASLLSLRLA